MSWTSDKATIIAGLPSGYLEIPLNVEPDSEHRPESHNHRAYSLKLRGVTDIQMQSADLMSYSHTVQMKVIYTAMDKTLLITNEELALTLMNTISNISTFHMYAESPVIEELTNTTHILNLIFHFGYDTNE
jgi:hypothetical protein